MRARPNWAAVLRGHLDRRADRARVRPRRAAQRRPGEPVHRDHRQEQQADCFAGAYSRWVAEGRSPRFTLSTGDGLNRVLAGAISLADPVWTRQDADMVEEGHGTALDRTRAFQQGFVDGTASCAAIDLPSIEQQRGDQPILLQQDSWATFKPANCRSTSPPCRPLWIFSTRSTPQSPPGLSFDDTIMPRRCRQSSGVVLPQHQYRRGRLTCAAGRCRLPAGTSDYALQHARASPSMRRAPLCSRDA